MLGTGLVRLIAVASFAFILFMPVSQGGLLMAVFGLMVLAAAMTLLMTGRSLSPAVALIALVVIAFGLYGLAVGIENPGFMNAAGIFVGTPLLIFFCIAALGQGSIRALLTTAAIMTVVSGVFILVYVGGQMGLLPQVIPVPVLELVGAGFGEKGGATAIRFYGLSTLAASAPMWLASIFVREDAMLPRIPIRAAAAVAGISGAMVGGRRAIIMGLLVIPVIAWFLKRATVAKSGPRKVSPKIVIAGLLLTFPAILALPKIAATPIISDTWQATVSFFAGSTVSASNEEYLRTYQVERLLGAWAESPIWGHGLGATIIGYQRSDRQPWQFEMQYPALLMQTGLIGLVILVVLAVLVVNAVNKATALRPDLMPSLIVTLCGGAAMLIANATNPYLQAPAHQWAIFLPLAVINLMLRTPHQGTLHLPHESAATQKVTK
jgi:hypothetical protein